MWVLTQTIIKWMCLYPGELKHTKTQMLRHWLSRNGWVPGWVSSLGGGCKELCWGWWLHGSHYRVHTMEQVIVSPYGYTQWFSIATSRLVLPCIVSSDVRKDKHCKTYPSISWVPLISKCMVASYHIFIPILDENKEQFQFSVNS